MWHKKRVFLYMTIISFTSGCSISCQSSSQWLRQPEKRRIVLLVQIGLGSFIDKRQTQIIKGFLGCHCQPFQRQPQQCNGDGVSEQWLTQAPLVGKVRSVITKIIRSSKVEILIQHTCVSMQPVAGAGPSLAGPCRSGVASFFTLDTRSMKKKLKYATYHKVKPVSFTQVIIAQKSPLLQLLPPQHQLLVTRTNVQLGLHQLLQKTRILPDFPRKLFSLIRRYNTMKL